MHADTLKALAGKYVWWKSSDEAVLMPERVIAQVMNIGDWDDVQALATQVGDDALREVLAHAQAGQFNARSWAYWHYRLGLCDIGEVPPLPVRRFGCPSVDFDFFSAEPLDRDAIRAAMPFVANATTLQDHGQSWVVMVTEGGASELRVKISFFGTIAFGRVGDPDITQDGVLQVASLDDLMATKVKVVLQRAEAKDYRDVAAMIRAGVSLPRGLSSARLLFGPNFQPSESLKALAYFEDGDLATLTTADKQTLVAAAKAVRDLPEVALVSRQLVGMRGM